MEFGSIEMCEYCQPQATVKSTGRAKGGLRVPAPVEEREGRTCACECLFSDLMELYMFGKTCRECHHKVLEGLAQQGGDCDPDYNEGVVASST
jgi:hypothetical protein